jgi:hypothetical protein
MGASTVLRRNSQISLSPARQRLVELVRRIHFGRIENLTVRGGDPLFDRGETVVREVKFGGENEPRFGSHAGAALTDRTVEMFRYFDTLGNCLVRFLEVKHGKPFKMNVVAEHGDKQ